MPIGAILLDFLVTASPCSHHPHQASQDRSIQVSFSPNVFLFTGHFFRKMFSDRKQGASLNGKPLARNIINRHSSPELTFSTSSPEPHLFVRLRTAARNAVLLQQRHTAAPAAHARRQDELGEQVRVTPRAPCPVQGRARRNPVLQQPVGCRVAQQGLLCWVRTQGRVRARPRTEDMPWTDTMACTCPTAS